MAYLTAVIKAASQNGAIGGALALATRPDYATLLSQIKVPTLVFVGLEDPLYPFEIAKSMNQAIPGSQLAVIPGGAHAAIFGQPDQASQAILSWAAGSPVATMPGLPNTGGGALPAGAGPRFLGLAGVGAAAAGLLALRLAARRE